MSKEGVEKQPIPPAESEKDDVSIASLTERESELAQENKRIKFMSCLICVILLDLLLFQAVENWAGAIVVGIFQLILILFVGKMLGIKDVDKLMTRILNAISGNNDKEEESGGKQP